MKFAKICTNPIEFIYKFKLNRNRVIEIKRIFHNENMIKRILFHKFFLKLNSYKSEIIHGEDKCKLKSCHRHVLHGSS